MSDLVRYFVDSEGRYIGSFTGYQIDDGTVVPAPAPANAALEAPGRPERETDRWLNGAWHPDLSVELARRVAEVDAGYAARLDAGLAHLGKVIQLRPQDHVNFCAMRLYAADVDAGRTTWPAGFAWRCADNTFLPLGTPEDMKLLAVAAADRVYALRKAAWSMKDTLAALDTFDALAAFDIDAGWPT